MYKQTRQTNRTTDDYGIDDGMLRWMNKDYQGVLNWMEKHKLSEAEPK